MADGANPAPVGGARVASFKIPYAWDNNAPKFTTDDHEDLMTFVDHVNQIMEHAGVTDDAERKLHFTSYLPTKRKATWRALPTYQNGTYEEFLKEIYLSYPEIKSERAGTIDLLQKLCKRNRGITVKEEGRLRRFGIEFLTEVKKLLTAPVLITNQIACDFYYETLEHTFATTLKMSIESSALLRAQIPALLVPAINPANAANTGESRVEDPIDVADLVKLAETLARSQSRSASLSVGTKDEISVRPLSFPTTKSNLMRNDWRK
jgi:hypothetical protein